MAEAVALISQHAPLPSFFFPPSWIPVAGCQQPDYKVPQCLEDCGARPFLLATNVVSETRGNTQLFLKLKEFIHEMRLTSTWASDVHTCTKPRTTLLLLVANPTKLV